MEWTRQWLKDHLGWGLFVFALAYLLIGWFWSWKITLYLVVGSIVVIALEAGYDFVQERVRVRVARRYKERRVNEQFLLKEKERIEERQREFRS